MRRHHREARADWPERARALDFSFANTPDGSYWDETACWELTEGEVSALESATAEIERLCLLAVDHAVSHGRFGVLGIAESVWPLIVQSWRRRDPSLYGRLDLRWDGVSPPKLLEYNADTPTTLYEASVVQWEWLTSLMPAADQFNSLHEALIARWSDLRRLRPRDFARLHFTCMRDPPEDRGTIAYLRDTAMQAGIDAPFIAIEDIGWDGASFRDLDAAPMRGIFKLYPWDWLLHDAFGAHIGGAATRWIEPAWRLILASKGILALLWELFPGHPNLLPAYREAGRVQGEVIAKPLFGREGANIAAPGISTDGPYWDDALVYQAWCPLPCVEGRHAVFGSWLVGGKPHGLGIREDPTPITRDTSAFVPHFFVPDS